MSVSTLSPSHAQLYLIDGTLYSDKDKKQQVELIEIIFGKVDTDAPPGYSPAVGSTPSVYRVYSGVTGEQPSLPLSVQTVEKVIESANFEGLNLPSIFTVNSIPTNDNHHNYTFTFHNVDNNPYNTGWDIFNFVVDTGLVDPKLSVKRPDS